MQSASRREPAQVSPGTRLNPSEASNGVVDTAKAVTGRPPNACSRCRGRKVKCNCEKPACGTCVKAKAVCEYPERSAAPPSWRYVEELEARVRSAEGDARPTKRKRSISSARGPEVMPASPIDDYTSMSSPHTKPTSTLLLAPPSSSQLFDRLPTAIDLEGVSLELPEEGMKRDGNWLSAHLSGLPEKQEMMDAVQFFLTYINSAFCIAHGPRLQNSMLSLYHPQSRPSQMDAYCGWMLMAIYCVFRARGKPVNCEMRLRAQGYWASAKRYQTTLLQRTTVSKLQAIHLALQYVLRVPEAGDVWELVGNAVRCAFDLGFHLEIEGAKLSAYTPVQLDMRRRLFWATYCIDQKVAIALGRPPGIVHDWISVKYPSLVDDEYITDAVLPIQPISHVKESALHHIQLRELQAQIYHRLCTVVASRSLAPDHDWHDTMASRLDDWRQSYFSTTDELLTTEWLDLHLNLSRLVLFRPNPGNPDPDRACLVNAITAASFLMRRYKAMWRAKTINFVWLAIHHVFISGVTYLNCLWIAAKHDWVIIPSFVDAVLDIQSCSQVLEGMTESQYGMSSVRDAFEVVSAAVIRRLSAMSESLTTPASTEAATFQPLPSYNGADSVYDWQTWHQPDGVATGTVPQLDDAGILDNFFASTLTEQFSLDDLFAGMNSGT